MNIQFFTSLDRTINRDQFCKKIMYISKLVQVYLNWRNSYEYSDRFYVLAYKLDETRKLFRLFKFVNEFNKIKQTYYDSNNKDKVNKFIDICIFRCYVSYWLFDNLAILSKLFKLQQNDYDQPYFNQIAQKFKIIATVFNVIQSLRNLLVLEYYKVTQLESSKTSQKDYFTVQQNIKLIQKNKTLMYSNLAKSVCDLLVAVLRIDNVYYKITQSRNENQVELLIGLAGLISSFLFKYHNIKVKSLQF